jgi:transcriptional regulator with XRE-family HTH domain
MIEPIDILGVEIRKARRKAGLKLADVAERAGCSPGYVSEIERGARLPPPATIRNIAAVLDTSYTPWLWLWVRNHLGAEDTERVASFVEDREEW